MSNESKNIMRANEKLISFLALVGAVVGLVLLAGSFNGANVNDVVAQGKLRIIDSAVTGLLTVLGMCARSIFELVNTSSEKVADAVAESIKAKSDYDTSTETRKVEVVNPPSDPVNTTETSSTEEVPPYARG
jgi:hypothetical protein